MYSLWQNLSHGTIIFDLVTLTLKFDLLLKNFNLGHNFLTRSDRAFYIALVYSLWQDLSYGTIIFDLVTLTLKFDLLLKNFNHGFYLVMVAARRASLSSDNSYWEQMYVNDPSDVVSFLQDYKNEFNDIIHSIFNCPLCTFHQNWIRYTILLQYFLNIKSGKNPTQAEKRATLVKCKSACE